MPIHDWSRVPSGLFHDFHQSWSIRIKDALNSGRLPKESRPSLNNSQGRESRMFWRSSLAPTGTWAKSWTPVSPRCPRRSHESSVAHHTREEAFPGKFAVLVMVTMISCSSSRFLPRDQGAFPVKHRKEYRKRDLSSKARGRAPACRGRTFACNRVTEAGRGRAGS